MEEPSFIAKRRRRVLSAESTLASRPAAPSAGKGIKLVKGDLAVALEGAGGKVGGLGSAVAGGHLGRCGVVACLSEGVGWLGRSCPLALLPENPSRLC